MQTWIPAGDALMGMFVTKLPSPVQAQKSPRTNVVRRNAAQTNTYLPHFTDSVAS